MVKGDLLKNLKLSAFILFYLIMCILTFAFLQLFGYFLISGSLLNSGLGKISLALTLFFIIEVVIGITVVAINGKRCGCFKKAVIYYPYLWMISFVNYGLFFYALYEEWIKEKN
jgi:hypothetical protein